MSAEWLLPGATKDGASITAEWEPATDRCIDGVHFREVRHVISSTGHLTELYRADWGLDAADVGQVFQVALRAGAVSAWHAHGTTRDRLFVTRGSARIVLYDNRPGSPTCGRVQELRVGTLRPGLVVVPPRVWHGVQALGAGTAHVINIVDRAYEYGNPDHWRVPDDSPHIPFRFR